MADLLSLPQPKQLIYQLRSCLSQKMVRTLEISLDVPPTLNLLLNDVLNQIYDFVRGQTNEALQRLAFSLCRHGENLWIFTSV